MARECDTSSWEGEAVIFYGHVRLTGDVDFFYARDSENLGRLFSALREFWAGDVPGLQGPEELSPEGTIVQFGQPPNRLDLISSIEGVDFEEAWEGRLEATLVSPRRGRAAVLYRSGRFDQEQASDGSSKGPRRP